MHDGTGGADSPANRAQRDPELFLRWLQFGGNHCYCCCCYYLLLLLLLLFAVTICYLLLLSLYTADVFAAVWWCCCVCVCCSAAAYHDAASCVLLLRHMLVHRCILTSFQDSLHSLRATTMAVPQLRAAGSCVSAACSASAVPVQLCSQCSDHRRAVRSPSVLRVPRIRASILNEGEHSAYLH